MVTDLVIQPSSSGGRIWRDMKRKFLLSALIGMSSIHSVFGHVEELDFHYWYSADLPLPGGWTHELLNKGVEGGDWKGGAYFKYNEMGWLLSPVFTSPIRSVTLYAATTIPNPSRRLHLHPIVNGVVMESGMDVLPTESRNYMEQVFPLGGCRANQFALRFSQVGNGGNWGIERIIVRYGEASTDDEEVPPRSWSLAAIARKPGWQSADFSMLQHVRSGVDTPWKNGVSIAGFHAFADTTPCTDIHLATNFLPRASGLYALGMTDGDVSTRVLAMRGTSGAAMSLMLPVALDAKRRMVRLSIDHRVWESPEAEPFSLSFSYRTLDDLSQMNGTNAGWMELVTTTNGNGSLSADVPVAVLQDRKFVCFRWFLPKKEKRPAIGISDVRVSAELDPSGLAVFIR